MFISRFIQANYFKKYLAENAVNTISEPLDFKIFWGECSETPLQTRTSGPRFQPPHLEIRSAVPVTVDIVLQKARVLSGFHVLS